MNMAEIVYDESTSLRYRIFVNCFLYPQGMRSFVFRKIDVRDGEKILDAGCGFGLLSKAIADKAAREGSSEIKQHAFDISPQMLSLFRSRCSFPVDMRQGDVRHLSYPDEYFDLILTAAMLEYVPNIKDGFVSLGRTLKSGGRMYVFMSRKTALNNFLFRPFGDPKCYSPQELVGVVNEIGFSGIQQEYFTPAFFWLNAWGFILRIIK
ncbi:MAG: methyltransferase domain-containing protein [Candidatus Abyssobacteria bacterium SURF_5]|uniref:Methyltransferase domain-containing protein n=1 Tax=Abyssobacteria bacterium (strain SURF_5) TaxID=2093360 RepID=A0A3A4NUW2_ABYX5|nr:MAG: methyltransferase domain-containing protein [Candidatus Abyssubacteria bacterium SURF_5]